MNAIDTTSNETEAVEVTLASALEEAVAIQNAAEAARESISDIEEDLAELQEALGSSTVAAIIQKVEAHALALEALEEKAIECAASLDALVDADECDDEGEVES